MDTTKRKGRFADTQSVQKHHVIMDLEIKRNRFQRGECDRWNDLPNELLLHIFQYLPHIDLQQVRMVCKRWRYLAQLPEFLTDSKLVVTRENVTDLYNALLADDELALRLNAWNSIELDNLHSTEELHLILHILGMKVHALHLHNSPVLELLNQRLPCLEELTLTHISAIKNNFVDSNFWLNDFKNLKAVDMACTNLHLNIKAHILRELASDDVVKLEKLCLEMNHKHEDLLISALQCHASALQHLEIVLRSSPVMISKWKQVFGLMGQLHTLKITGDSCFFWLRNGFESIPASAPLKHLDLSGSLQVIDSFLIFIVKKWPTLETLELMFCNTLTDESISHLGILSSSLVNLNLAHCSRISTLGLLQGLVRQTNYKLTSLWLTDVMDADTEGMCLLAQRLPNLTYLSLDSCRDSVTDATLAQIFRYQTRLQHLALDDCMRITDEGLLGYGASPAPIHNLKGLKSLSLRGCRNLSNRALSKGLKFVELRKLILGYCHKVSSMGIEELVENCPALEDLTISSCLMIDDDAMLHIAKGLPRLTRLNVSNCINLTAKSIDCVVELCTSLKELSMCGIDSLEIQEVQDKFLQIRPKFIELTL